MLPLALLLFSGLYGRQLARRAAHQPSVRSAMPARTISNNKRQLSPEHRDGLLRMLKPRFEQHMSRHKGLEWDTVQARLSASAPKLWSLSEMERTGGEPDVVGHDSKTGECTFCD